MKEHSQKIEMENRKTWAVSVPVSYLKPHSLMFMSKEAAQIQMSEFTAVFWIGPQNERIRSSLKFSFALMEASRGLYSHISEICLNFSSQQVGRHQYTHRAGNHLRSVERTH